MNKTQNLIYVFNDYNYENYNNHIDTTYSDKKIRLAAMDFLWPGPLLDKMRLTTINIIIISIIIYIIVSIIISIIISIFV